MTTSDATVESAAQLIGSVFGGTADGDALAPDTLVGQMEAALGAKRDSWPISAIRRFGDVLIEVAAGRKKSPRHEVRWLNLSGFCLRSGFGVPGDNARVNDLRRIASNELVFVDDLQCQVGKLVLLRRIVAGINASEQQALYRKHSSPADDKKKGRVNRLDSDVSTRTRTLTGRFSLQYSWSPPPRSFFERYTMNKLRRNSARILASRKECYAQKNRSAQ